jgi:AhpD family alkylhydroperoxidase
VSTEARIDYAAFSQLAPTATAALSALSKAAADSGLAKLDKQLIELLKIRASQINGCTFCLQYHLNLARKANLSQTKLDLVAVWREAGIFNAKEMAALEWTEALTHVTPTGVADEVYERVRQQFSETELALLTSAVAGINAWNRIAIALRFTPPIPQDSRNV